MRENTATVFDNGWEIKSDDNLYVLYVPMVTAFHVVHCVSDGCFGIHSKPKKPMLAFDDEYIQRQYENPLYDDDDLPDSEA